MFSNETFAQNAEKYMDTVFRVAYGWLKNPDDANDERCDTGRIDRAVQNR